MKKKQLTALGAALLLGVTPVIFTTCSNPFFPARNPRVPVITSHPQDAVYRIGDTAAALTVNASVSDDGTLSYKWYKNTTNSNSGGSVIAGAAATSCIPPTNQLGITYYYAVVTNTIDGRSASASSNTAKIEIRTE